MIEVNRRLCPLWGQLRKGGIFMVLAARSVSALSVLGFIGLAAVLIALLSVISFLFYRKKK